MGWRGAQKRRFFVVTEGVSERVRERERDRVHARVLSLSLCLLMTKTVRHFLPDLHRNVILVAFDEVASRQRHKPANCYLFSAAIFTQTLENDVLLRLVYRSPVCTINCCMQMMKGTSFFMQVMLATVMTFCMDRMNGWIVAVIMYANRCVV